MSRSRLYVGNVSSRVRTDDLEDEFRRYGRVRHVSVRNGYAFVEMDDERDAEDAVRRLDGKDLEGRKLQVEFSRDPRDRRGPPPGTGRCFNCGKDGHWARDCQAGDFSNKCYRCGDKGHIERDCKSDKAEKRRSRSRSPRRDKGDKDRGRSRSRDKHRSRSPKKDDKKDGEGNKDKPKEEGKANGSTTDDKEKAPPQESEGSPRRASKSRSPSPKKD